MRTRLLIALTLLFTTYLYGQERTKTLYLDKGSITITETGYTQNTTQETKFTGSYVITQSNSSSYTTNMIDVKSGNHTITLNGVKAGDSEAAPFSLSKDVELTLFLTGENILGCNNSDKAKLHVPPGAILTIKGDGKLTTSSRIGAAIGGNSGENCGIIIIESGTIAISLWARRRLLLRQGPDEGGPLRGLRRALDRQEHRGCRSCVEVPGAARLRHRRGASRERARRDLRHRHSRRYEA